MNMILDPTGQFIKNITEQCDITGKEILEIGCGSGRITRDLAKYARKVVAIDPDERALQVAQAGITHENVEFIRCSGEALPFAENTFDLPAPHPQHIYAEKPPASRPAAS